MSDESAEEEEQDQKKKRKKSKVGRRLLYSYPFGTKVRKKK